MRTKKAIINSSINIITFVLTFIPNLILRKVFLEELGGEILGLNSLYSNIIGWLSIIELGIGTAIIYSLYKPYAENDYKKVKAYINFYGKFYRIIGCIILGVGIALIPMLKFFIEGNIDLDLVRIGFTLSLVNTFISYMFTHKLCILNVAQETYKITIGTTISKLLIMFLQYFILKIYKNFTFFIFIQIIINLTYYFFINWYITRKYPWLRKCKENLMKDEKKSLIKNVKAMFMHKIGGLFVNSTDNIVISKFVGLEVLAKYTNYQTIILAMQTIVNVGLGGLTASIGNMLVSEDKDKAFGIHKRIFFMSFWIISFFVITLYNTLNQFIVLWIGEKFLLDNITFIIILVNLYFSSMRGSVEQFQSGSGNFHQDRYAPFIEAIINIITSINLVRYIGIAGVFIGTLVSNLTVIFWTKPYVVYKYVFEINVIEYFKMYFKYLFIGIIPLIITVYLTRDIKYNYSIYGFILNCIINIIIINSFYLLVFFRTDEFKYFNKLLRKYIFR